MGGIAATPAVRTAATCRVFARMLIDGGAGTLAVGRTVAHDLAATRRHVERARLGWDINTSYSRTEALFPIGSFGHTGFTGTSLWVDEIELVVFLSSA